MKKEQRYCYICGKDCEFVILHKEDEQYVAWGSSHVVARGSSHVVAWGSSHVVAWESSHVVAWGSSHVEARGSSHVEATCPYVGVTVKSKYAKIKGGTQYGMTVIPATQWLEKCGVEIKRGYVILYKSVTKDFTTKNNISFKPKTKHEAPDWDAKFTDECGSGIHYCPTVAQCRQFRDDGVYVACRVKVSDIADLPAFADYPDKIRAKGGYTLYEVDENGKNKEIGV